MRIGIVQLSDIHFHEAPLSQSMRQKIVGVSRAIGSLKACYGTSQIIIIISGDIAYSGLEKEYQHALELIDTINKSAAEHNVTIMHYVVVPGNHDCDFRKDTKARQALLSTIQNGSEESFSDSSVIELCTSVQSDYRQFSELCQSHDAITESQLYSHFIVRLTGIGKTIAFHLLNTAWVSKKSETQGTLRYPIHGKGKPSSDPAVDFSVAVMHHPLIWQSSDNAKSLTQWFQTMVDVVVTGHEHVADTFGRLTRKGDKLTFLEGGVLFDDKNESNSAFNILIVDMAANTYDMYIYSWCSENQVYVPRKEQDTYHFRNRSRKLDGYVIRERFANEELKELGLGLTHRHHTMTLRDLFVYPDFREFSLAPNATAIDTIFGFRINEYILSRRKVLIMGGDQAGKSTLAKILFEDFHGKGFIPVLLHGRDFAIRTDDGIRATIAEKYEVQYESPPVSLYWQMISQKRVIILDDYHKIKYSGVVRSRIIRILSEIADIVVILGAYEAMLDELGKESRDAGSQILVEFSYCSILEFGHVRQSDLVRKWFSLGRDGETEDSRNQRERQAEHAARTIQNALSHDFVPAHPITILGMLYQIETQTALDVSCSSYGHLFDVLVKTNLGVSKRDAADFNLMFTYLSELAFFMYKTKQFRLDRLQQGEWHSYYKNAYRPPIDCERIVSDLVESQVLSMRNGDLSFRYKYHYYYFAARYFADHISDPDAREHVSAMSRRLYNEDSANIILFICHFSKDRFIINSIIDIAKNLFERYPACQMGADIKSLNEALSQSLPTRELLLPANNDPEKNRQRILAEQDKSDESKVTYKSGDQISVPDLEDSEEVSDGEDEILQANATFKTIQILGQTLRSFYGSMRNEERLNIARESYSLGLRLLSFYVAFVTDQQAFLHESFVSFLRSRRAHMQEDEAVHLANRFILGLAEFFGIAVIQHIASSVGTQRLSETLADLLREKNDNAHRLIDLSIKLDNYQNFPIKEVESLAKESRGNPYAWSLLRRLIWQHFYLHDEDYRLAQKVCSLVEIPYQRTHSLPASTKRD